MKTQVLIVGAGPVGLMAAVELSRYGVAVRIVDKLAQATDKSKALAVWSRSLELFDRSGVSAPLIAAGNKADATNFFAGGAKLGQVTFEGVDSPYPFVLLIPQNETERVLREQLSRFGVEVERGAELTAFTTASDGVTATVSHPDGQRETLQVDWLVGCDGAHSTVRHILGKEFVGDTVPTEFVLADVHLVGMPTPTSQISMFSHSDGVLAIFPITANRYRIIADVGPAREVHRADPTLDEVQAIVDRRGPAGVRVTDPVWLSVFRVNERQVADFRSGSVFLAGDAAHVHSPAGGQGMNIGLGDACNLAWKLALVCQGKCEAEPLLQSYSLERSPIAHQIIVQSGRLTAMMTTPNHLWQSVRNNVAGLVLGLAPVRHVLADTLSELTLGYPHSPLTQSHAPVHGGPDAGDRAPIRSGEAPLGAGATPRFTLFAQADEAAEAIVTKYADLVEPAVRTPFRAGGIWLVRPDGYIGVAAKSSSAHAVSDYLAAVARPQLQKHGGLGASR